MLIDYFSKFLIVRKLPNSTTGAIVKELSITLSEYGIPFIIWSDNGPCYSSQEFKTFLQDLQITHRTSSPHYPQSNGMAESMVKISKNLIEKAIQSDKPWHSFIRDYTITPLSNTIPSPQKYCLEGDSDPIFPSYHHSSPTAELHISMRKLPRRKISSMKSQLQLQILYQDNLYGIRIHSPRNGYQVQYKKNFRSHIPTPLYPRILQPCTGGTEII